MKIGVVPTSAPTMRGSQPMRAITSTVAAAASARSIGSGRLLRDPGDARHHQRERDREPAFLQREGQRQRERRDRAGGEERAGRGEPGRGSRLPSISVAMP